MESRNIHIVNADYIRTGTDETLGQPQKRYEKMFLFRSLLCVD